MQGSIAEFIGNRRRMRNPAGKNRRASANFAIAFPPSNARITSELSSYRVRKKPLRDEPAFSDQNRDFSLGVQAGFGRALRRLQNKIR